MAVCAHDPKADDTEERRKGYKAKMKQWFSGSRLALDTVKDGHNSGPPSASSGVQTRASSQRESAAGLPRPGRSSCNLNNAAKSCPEIPNAQRVENVPQFAKTEQAIQERWMRSYTPYCVLYLDLNLLVCLLGLQNN